MRIKFTYLRPGGAAVDLVAEVEAQGTVGQLAAHLAQADPERGNTPSESAKDLELVTLTVGSTRNQVLDREQLLADSPMASGTVVSLAQGSMTYAEGRPDSDAAARLRVIAGPDAGREFALAVGSAMLAREHGCDVRLTDAMVSRRHERLNISETVEVIDQGSVNGLMVGLAVVKHTMLSGGRLVALDLSRPRGRHTTRGRVAQTLRARHGRDATRQPRNVLPRLPGASS